MSVRDTALLCALLIGCGGEETTTAPPVAPTTSAGDETVAATPEGPNPEEVTDLFGAIALGPVEAGRQRLSQASYGDAQTEEARGACLSVLEAMLAGAAETFDLDRHCVARLGQLAEATGEPAPDTSPYLALRDQARAARQAAAPPLPEGFSASGERTFTGTLSDDDPRLPNNDSPHDDYPIELRAGSTVHIDLTSEHFDCYLWLLNDEGRTLVQDDDGGEGLNSHIDFSVDLDGRYILRVGAFGGRGRGAYELRVAIE